MSLSRRISRRALLFAVPVVASTQVDAAVLTTPQKRAAAYAAGLCAALQEMNPGTWAVDLAPERGFAVLHRLSK